MFEQVDLCWKHRIFAVVEGAFDEQRQPLMEFLERKKSMACKISGKASTGEVGSKIIQRYSNRSLSDKEITAPNICYL